jgi:hypothetical protein
MAKIIVNFVNRVFGKGKVESSTHKVTAHYDYGTVSDSGFNFLKYSGVNYTKVITGVKIGAYGQKFGTCEGKKVKFTGGNWVFVESGHYIRNAIVRS